MYLSSLFCFLLETFDSCIRRRSFMSCLFFSFSVTVVGRISSALLSLPPSCSSLFLTLCLRCLGTNLGISTVWLIELQLVNLPNNLQQKKNLDSGMATWTSTIWSRCRHAFSIYVALIDCANFLPWIDNGRGQSDKSLEDTHHESIKARSCVCPSSCPIEKHVRQSHW